MESIINEDIAVRESACIGLLHELNGEVLVCFVALKPGYARAGKIMRRIIRAVMMGNKSGDISVIENPESLGEIRRAALNPR